MLTLTSDELDEVRLLTGVYNYDSDLPDARINTQVIVGEASDYVIGELLRNVDISKLQDYSTIEEARSASPDDFIMNSLSETQRLLFRSSVVYRCSGLSMPLLAPYFTEGSDQIVTQRREIPDWRFLRSSHFASADEQIVRIKSIDPNDAFIEDVDVGALGFFTTCKVA
jgi:hypothetical protein